MKHWLCNLYCALFVLTVVAPSLVQADSPNLTPTLVSASERRQILNFLQSDNSQDILIGLSQISKLRIQESKPILLKLATHSNPKVASMALDILVSRKDPDASPLVRQNIAHSIKPKERVEAIDQLGKLENPADFPFFLRLLDIENLETRLAVISWIGKLKISNAVFPLVQVLEDSRDTVRAEALKALSAVSRKHAILPIIARLSDTSVLVRKTAISLLTEEDLPIARHALMRLLQTGTREERMDIFKIFPITQETRPYLLDLLRSSKNEEIPRVLSLFSGDIDFEILQDLVNLAASDKYTTTLQEMISQIRVENVTPLINWILAPNSFPNIRVFCSLILVINAPRIAEDIIRKAWHIGYLTGQTLAQLYMKAPNPLPLGLLTEVFEQGDLQTQRAIVETFIQHRDDRLAPVFLAHLTSNPKLKSLVIPYARATQGHMFVEVLLNQLYSVENLHRRDLLITLKSIPELDQKRIVAAGNFLSGEELILWSDLIWAHLDTTTLMHLNRLPVTSYDLERELAFLHLVSVMNGWEPLVHFKTFQLSKNPDLHHLWVAYAANSMHPQIPASLDEFSQALFLDLLPDGPLPQEYSKQVPTHGPLVQALARFQQTEAKLEAYLQSTNPCIRINAARAYVQAPKRRLSFLLTLLENETQAFVVLNLLRGVSASEQTIAMAIRLCQKVPELCRQHMPYITKTWPKDARTRVSEWLETASKDVTTSKIHKKGMVRFHFQALPRNLACIVVDNPLDGARALTVPAENELVVLHLKHDVVSLYPVYK